VVYNIAHERLSWYLLRPIRTGIPIHYKTVEGLKTIRDLDQVAKVLARYEGWRSERIPIMSRS
jgi:hypothetical protein